MQERSEGSKHKVDAVGADADGVTELMRWSFEGVPEAVHYLLTLGAQVGARDRFGFTALFYAVEGKGNPVVLEMLIKHGGIANDRAPGGFTPLMAAIPARSTNQQAARQILQILVAHGADVNAQDEHGRTALMFSAYADQQEIANELLALGANPNAKTKAGHGISYFAGSDRRLRAVRYFEQIERGEAGNHTKRLNERAEAEKPRAK